MYFCTLSFKRVPKNSTSFWLHKTWINHHGFSKGGLELLIAQGSRKLWIATPSLQPGALNTNRLCSEQVNKLLSPASSMADAPASLHTWPAMQSSVPVLVPRSCKEPRKTLHQPCILLRPVFTVQCLGFLSPRASHIYQFHFSPSLGSPTPPATQRPCYLTVDKVAIKSSNAWCTSSAVQTLWDLIWNICHM